MNGFSNDVDILKYEPILFGDLRFAGQVVVSGAGAIISNSTLNVANANFINAQILSGMVCYLQSSDGLIDGAYEIILVDSATQVKISVLRQDNQSDIIPVADNNELKYWICTYRPQSNELLFQISQHFGLRPGVSDADYSVDDILDASVLKQVSVFGVLSIVYATLAGRANEEKDNYWKKSNYYRQLYEKAMQRCRVCIDLGSDGVADSVRSGASVRLLRD